MTANRAAALAFTLTFALLVSADEPRPIPWHSSPATALSVARAQQKVLFVQYRGACGKCNDRMDAMLEKAAGDPVFMHAFDTFLPLRVTRGTPAAEHPMFVELDRAAETPQLAIFDATGLQLLMLDRKLTWAALVEDLLRLRGERARIVRSVELRDAGKAPEADLMVGNALFNARQPMDAVTRLQSAAKAFKAANADELAQIAAVFEGNSWYLAKFKAKGRKMITEVLEKPVSDAVAAEAHYALGMQYEEAAAVAVRVVTNVQDAKGKSLLNQREKAKAIESYRQAYLLAPEGSIAFEQAKYALARIDTEPLPSRKLGARPSLRVVPPARVTILGDADFSAETTGNIARVDYLLDDVKVASSTKHPFRVSIDVGRTPRVRTIKAIAFGEDGAAKGEAITTINDRMDAFFVSIVAPAEQWIGGAKDVELDVRVPPGRALVRVELSWNGKDIGVLTKAPFRTRMNVEANEFGYLRAVAVLDDGESAESTKIYNAAGVSESVEVGAVTVIASVTDAKGDRIAGLGSGDFTIADEGQRVTPTLRSSDADPVTIGVAIDSSSSMSGMQIYVIRAATEFLGRALRPQDHAFVVAFDNGARLVHRRSSDAAKLRESVYALAPQGGTSIFDGVTFALQQFQGIAGKKALLVFSDGFEGTSSASARECERLARTVGVPIYVVVPPGGNRYTNALKGISGDTGGTMFIAEPEETFPTLFDRLAQEMRGQYVLSFTRPAGIKPGTWRSIRVAVQRDDANVRAIQGYRAN
jgi:VWFA-related protein